MKIKAIAAICRKNKMLCLYDSITSTGEIGAQWLGDRHAVYLLQGLPLLEEDSICTMFDITEKQQDKITFRHDALPEGINFDNTDQREYQLDDQKLDVVLDGRILKPLQTQQGIVFIDAAYLAPFADVMDMLELYERIQPDGQIYIVAKLGMFIAGVISPYNIIRKEFVAQLGELWEQCRCALNHKERRKAEREAAAPDEPEQATFE